MSHTLAVPALSAERLSVLWRHKESMVGGGGGAAVVERTDAS